MNRADFKGRSSLQMPGRGLTILLVIIFSSLSFTLGYFVGKSGREKKAEPVLQTAEINTVRQNQDEQPAGVSMPEEIEQTQVGEQPATDNKSGQQKPAAVAGDKVYEPLKGPADTLQKETGVKDRETSKEGRPPVVKVKTQAAELTYTVQLGALKNQAEAENFKAKYDKKGYKAYITISKDKNNERIYKVRTGEFTERKDAEILSLKIKKNEGLNTYVTFKNE